LIDTPAGNRIRDYPGTIIEDCGSSPFDFCDASLIGNLHSDGSLMPGMSVNDRMLGARQKCQCLAEAGIRAYGLLTMTKFLLKSLSLFELVP
jgi:hypothetical protein